MSGRPVARREPHAAARHAAARSVRRASAGLSAGRVPAPALAMLVSAAGDLRRRRLVRLRLPKLELTGRAATPTRAAVEAALGGARGENLFAPVDRPMVAALESLPTVRAAQVEVRLPGTLAVTLDERDADPRLAGRRAPLPGRRRRHRCSA